MRARAISHPKVIIPNLNTNSFDVLLLADEPSFTQVPVQPHVGNENGLIPDRIQSLLDDFCPVTVVSKGDDGVRIRKSGVVTTE